MSIARLLDCLQAVKQIGADRWTARCPSHPDRHPSLAIRETADHRVLLHCFGGCDVEAVLKAVDLRFADLIPELREKHMYQPSKPNHWHSACDALRVLAYESLRVAIAAENIAHGIQLSDLDRQRVLLAATRIRAASEACR